MKISPGWATKTTAATQDNQVVAAVLFLQEISPSK